MITKFDLAQRELWVRPGRWSSLTYQEKEDLARAAAIHVETRTNGPRRVTLRDAMNGRELGSYSEAFGFSIR